MKTYWVNYDLDPLVEIHMDSEKAAPFIREMVEFWMDWEDYLARAGGDYELAFVKRLALFLLDWRREPGEDDEGWYPFDEAHGIQVKNFFVWSPDPELIEIS